MATSVEPAGVPPSPSTLRATIAEWWRADRALLAAILLIAVAVRVAWVFGWTIHEPLEGDSIIYQAQANNLTDGYFWVDPWRLGLRQEVVPQADHPPLFVVYLGVFSFLGLQSDAAHIVASMLPGLPMVVLVALLAKELAGRRAGLLAGLVAAVDPNLWTWEGRVLSEPLAALLVTAATLAAFRTARAPTSRGVIGTLVLATLAGLTRAEFLLLIPVYAAVLGVKLWRIDRAQLRRAAAGSLVAGLLLVGPWAVFNSVRYGQPVIISTSLGRGLANGTCDEAFRGELRGFMDMRCLDPVNDANPGANDGELDPLYREHAMRYARDHVGEIPAVAAARIGRTIGLYRPASHMRLEQVVDGRRAPVVGIEWLFGVVLFAGYLAGLFVLRRSGRSVILAVAPIAAMFVGVLIVFGTWRYRVASTGVVIAVAVVAFDALLQWVAGRTGRTLSDRAVLTIGAATVVALLGIGLLIGMAHNVGTALHNLN